MNEISSCEGVAMKIKDIMQANVVTVRPDASLREAAQAMLEAGVNGLPVVDDERRVVGIIGLKDILRAPWPSVVQAQVSRMGTLSDKAGALDRATVERVMARTVFSVREDEPVMAAVAIMVNQGLHPVPVLRNGKLVGIVSRADAVRALLQVPAQVESHSSHA
jgi:CBS domain-containing protein